MDASGGQGNIYPSQCLRGRDWLSHTAAQCSHATRQEHNQGCVWEWGLGEGRLSNHFKISYCSPFLPLPYPSQMYTQPWETVEKNGLWAQSKNALYGCKDPRLANSFFRSSLSCLCSGSPVARSREHCWGTESASALRDWLVSGDSPGGQREDLAQWLANHGLKATCGSLAP